MADCRIAVRFDRPDRRYTSGEPVEGVVEVRAEDDVTAKAITIESYWRTSGWGNTDHGKYAKTELVADVNLRANEVGEYPFRIEAPDSPVTYGGQLLQIDQYVRARADIPWTIDPKIEERYELLPSEEALGSQRAPFAKTQDASRAWSKFRWAVLVIVAIVLWLIPFPWSVGAVAVVLLAAVAVGRNIVAMRKLGDVSVAIAATRVCPGESVPVRVSMQPGASVEIDGVVASLEVKESCTRGSGTDRRTRTHTLIEEKTTLGAAQRLGPREATRIDGMVTIPQLRAYSFKGDDNELTWTLNIRVAVAGWPDWVVTQKLEVVPGTPTPIEAHSTPNAITA